MKARKCRLTVEAMEDRSVPATMATGDFNHDGYDDVAEITSPTTVTVSLGSPTGSTVSAVLTVPSKQTITAVYANDYDGDGNLDIIAYAPAGGDWSYYHRWLGNGDGTFGEPTSGKFRWPPPPGHARNWV